MSRAILEGRGNVSRTEHPVELPKYFLWTKIGTESGESLETIIRRKEVEREACDGTFFWGVGNSVGESLSTLKKLSQSCSAVFSEMRSKAKTVDARPSRVLIWLGYEDTGGNRHSLPIYSFVTSRDAGRLGANSRGHYALICNSSDRIAKGSEGQLDAAALVNIRSGKPIGFSQVTSVVAMNRSAATEPMLYPVTFTANLVGPGQVRLVDPIEISLADVARVAASAESGALEEWKRTVVAVKRKIISNSTTIRESKAFPAQLDMLEA